jgi:hypothetical protein
MFQTQTSNSPVFPASIVPSELKVKNDEGGPNTDAPFAAKHASPVDISHTVNSQPSRIWHKKAILRASELIARQSQRPFWGGWNGTERGFPDGNSQD